MHLRGAWWLTQSSFPISPQAEEAKVAYAKAHIEKGTEGDRNGGAHFAYLSFMLGRSATGYVAETAEPTMVRDLKGEEWA